VLGPASAANSGGVIGAVRSDDKVAQAVSTVDTGGTSMGDITTVLALHEQLVGGSGSHRVAPRAQAPVPTPAAAPRGPGPRGAAGLAARAAWSALRSAPPGGRDRWDRRNHRGSTVTLLEGPALALAAAGTAGLAREVPTRLRLAGALAALGAGAFGVADDLGER